MNFSKIAREIEKIDDKGLEIAEALCHERRRMLQLHNMSTAEVERALAALSQVRNLTK